MHRYRKLALGTCVGISLLGLLSHTALANSSITFNIDGRGGRGPITATGVLTFRATTVTVVCNVTLRGELTTLSVAIAAAGRLPEALIVNVTEGRSDGRCTDNLGGRTGSITFLSTARLRYDAIEGELPTILGIKGAVLETAFNVVSSAPLAPRCLYRGQTEFEIFESSSGRRFNRLRFNERSIAFSSGELLCAREGALAGTLTVSPDVLVRLRNAEAPSRWIVSVGDSYIVGEGGRWAGNTARNNEEAIIDALEAEAYGSSCHDSLSAEIHIGEVSSKNLACSGAISSDVWGQLIAFAEEHDEIDAVVVSVGGNNFHVGEVAVACLEAYINVTAACSGRASVRQTIEPTAVRIGTEEIQAGLLDIYEAMSSSLHRSETYKIIVQNYPTIFPARGGFRYPEVNRGVRERHTIGGCEYYDVDAEWVDKEEIPAINRAIRDAVTAAALPNTLELNLSTVFEGRRLCERGVGLLEEMRLRSWTDREASDLTEWITANHLRGAITHPAFQAVESLHPNYWAQLALRNCLRQAYNGGAPRAGRCVRNGTGLNARSEPNMRFE